MGIIDTAILLLFLIFMIVGFFKGFLKQVFSTLAWIIALVAATLLSKPVGNSLVGTNIGINFISMITEWISGKGEVFSTPISELSLETLTSSLSQLGIPAFIQKELVNMIDLSSFQNISIAELIGPKIVNVLFIMLAFIIIYLIVFIIIKILGKLSSRIVRGSALGILDGTLGALWCGIKVAIFVSLAMLLLSFITTTPFGEPINQWITNDLRLNEQTFGIGKFFYENNPIMYIISILPFNK